MTIKFPSTPKKPKIFWSTSRISQDRWYIALAEDDDVITLYTWDGFSKSYNTSSAYIKVKNQE